jgi:hypothetical protein
MSNKLAAALKIAINALEKDFVYYKWKTQESCNCGVVVQAILGKTESEVKELFNEAYKEIPYRLDDLTWRGVAQFSCSITGQPMTRVFKILAKNGLRPEDVVHLEYLNNPAILEIAGINTNGIPGRPGGLFHREKPARNYYEDKENLIKYLKAWVCILEERSHEHTLSKLGELEAKLLLAINQEDYPLAAKLRDEISVLI